MSFTIPASPMTPEYLAEDLGPTITATASLMIIFCTVFVCLRYWARYLAQMPLGAEDVIIPFAWLTEMGLCITSIVMVKHTGAGRHTIIVLQEDLSSLEQYLKGITAHEFIHSAAVALPKLCVVLLFLRVFANKYERMAAWALMSVIFATWFSFTVATVFQCTPFAFIWDKSIQGGKCFNFGAYATSTSVPNIVTDVVVLFLPIRMVIGLKISIGRKAGLMLIFLTGSVGIVASIVRTVVFASINPTVDPMFTATPLLKWTMIEPGLYLLAACALSFKPLFRMIAQVLHLDKLLTHTKPSFSKTFGGRKTNAAGAPTVVRMDTFRLGSSGGFTKLSHGKDGAEYEKELRDVEEGDWVNESSRRKQGHKKGASEGAISVLVTRTVKVESETLYEEEDDCEPKFNVADQTFFNDMLADLDKRD